MRRLCLQVVTPARAFSVELPAVRSVSIGAGPGVTVAIEGSGLLARHLLLLVRDEGLVVEPVKGAAEVRLNDVQLAGPAPLEVGDELKVGDARLSLQESRTPAPARPRLAGEDELDARLASEALRSAPQSFAVALVLLPPLNTPARQALLRRLVDETDKRAPAACWGEWTGDVLMGLFPQLERGALEALLARLPAVAGPRAQVVHAVLPRDGDRGDRLLEAALARLDGEEPAEPMVEAPVQVRSFEAAELLAAHAGPLRVEGARGAGRATLARRWFEAAGLSPVPEVSAADAEGLEAALAAGPRALLLRDAGALSRERLEAALARAASGGSRVAFTVEPGEHGLGVALSLKVPALLDRPSEVLALAELFLSRARVRLARPRLSLSAEARALLQQYRWPGNVRELKTVVSRAARAAVRDELGRDALPARLRSEGPAEDFRRALQSTERELLLETLARTRWNVSAAATRLGMPRRTLVYRMGKLGLKRPAR